MLKSGPGTVIATVIPTVLTAGIAMPMMMDLNAERVVTAHDALTTRQTELITTAQSLPALAVNADLRAEAAAVAAPRPAATPRTGTLLQWHLPHPRRSDWHRD